MKELSKKKYVTLITIMILVLGIIGIVNIGNIDLDKGKVKLKSASIEKLKSSVIESKGYEEITYPVLYELEKVEGIEERNVIIKGTLTKEENKYARFKEITSKTITSTVSENGREIEIRIEKVKLGRQNKINIKIEINGAINETKIKPEIEIKEESEKEYTKVNTEEIEVKTNSVTGLVQDEEGMSVSNLELSINKGNEEIRRTYTDENGRYVFSDVEEGKYTIKVEEENYELKEVKEVEVIGGITENIIVKKIKPYEIEVKKYISKIKLNNNGKEIEYEYGKLNKVNQTVKNLKNLSGEIEYKIEIKNIGEKSGEITKIEEEVTEGLSFKKEKNSEWEEKNGKIINRSLEGIKLKAGEEKEITLKLDIEKTDEARSYLQKVTAKGEVYQNVVYILGGKEYRKEKVLEGEKIEEPKIVQENFKGWYTDKKYTNKYNFENSVTKDIILYGKVEESTKKYTVQYIDEGKIIKEEELEEGSIINAPEVTKEGYTFTGWYEGEEKYDVYEPITRNLILESKYEINKYKVRFINEDGSILQEETLDYGSTPTYKKETPTKKRTEEYTYEFDKWTPEITKVTSNQEYKATYKATKNKYTVTYINEGKEYHKETALYGNTIKNVENPTKEGYTFIGWYDINDKKVNHPITVTKNITLYSKYEINSYKVSYYNEGKKYIDDQKINYGENALKPNTNPSKIGYTFKYWSIKENGEEYEFSTKITKDITLYAVYEINKYTVTYINEGVEYHKETALYGSVVTEIQDPTKEGYTFTGWYTKDNEKVSYPITVTENITLYSKYEINSYKVSYYNEGKKYIDDQKINYGENALKPNTNPSKIGYTFKYWSIKENGEEYEFSTKITKDITLYAVYEINKYTVTYINEGTEYHKETAEYGSVVTSIQNPTKEGYTFIGWYNENNEKINHPITVTENITLHSKYEINTYTVSFYHNNEKYVEDQKVNYGESAVKPSIDPTKEDYNFSGWVIKGTNNKYDFTSKVTKDIELESSFTAKPTYTVTFKIGNEVILTENVIEGHKVTSKEAPYKKGYLFDKWYSDEGLTIENNFNEKIMNNKTIYGKYNENKHTVTYMNEKEVYYTEKVLDRFTAKGPSENPSKEGYTFKYFSKDKKVAFDYSAEITEDTTLYAVYEINKYTVTYINEGSEYHKEELTYKSKHKKIEDPFKTGYTFTGWYNENEEKVEYPITVTKNITLHSKYEINKYTVTFNDEDRITTKEVNYNAKVEPVTNQGKTGYTFKYWSIKENGEEYNFNTLVTENITLYAVYEINKYTITYINEGSEYHKEELTYGSKHEKIEDPFKTGYTFIGWYNENEEKVEYPITVTKNITLHSKYEINKYTVTFNDEDRITTKEVNYNAKVEPVTNQGKTGYTFKYWSIEKGGEEYNFNTLVTENITLYAVYSINKYTVTFKNYDGSTLQEETLEYGALSKYKGEVPTREKTKEYTYTFKGWDKEITEVTNNQEYIATYTETKNKYNVKFTNYDGSILQEETLEYGTLPVYKGEVPTREKTEEYTYTFKNWNKEITEVTDNEIYIATYTETKNKYTVIYMDGETEYTRKEVNYGETVSEEVINKDHNIYRGWTLEGNIYDFNTPVTKNITIKSSFELVESPVIESTPIEWTKENVKVTITTNHNDYSYMYKIDDGEYQNYNGEFTVDKNCIVIAKSIKENVESEVTTKEITNIDKVLPVIKEITEENITTKSFDIKVKGQDNESGLSEIRIYKNEELMVSYPYTERLNEEKEETYSLTGLEENTTYKIKVELIDKVGNVNVSEEKEITTLKRVIVSRIIGRNNSLYESEAEYELFESLEEAITSCGSNECTIEMVLDTKESVNVLEGQEIKLELNGKTVTGVRDYTIENSGELIIVDKEDSEGGIINNTDTAIKNIGNGILQIGENEEPLSVSITKPNIVGTTYGIYTEEETSKLKFYDGKIEGNVAIQGNVDDTPYLYNAKITNEGHQVATLSILAEAEAKITGGKYYTKLSNAVSETKSGPGTYTDKEENLLQSAYASSYYTFNYDEETNSLVSNNQNQRGTTAYSYIKIDLTDYTVNQELTVSAKILASNSTGCVHLNTSKDNVSQNTTEGRLLYMTGDQQDTAKVILQKGKIYYLHFSKSRNWADGLSTDIFTITDVTLNDYKVNLFGVDILDDIVTPGTYGFVNEFGKLKSNNKGTRYTSANSYLKVDLTNYIEDQKIYIDAEISSREDNDFGYVTITDNETIPEYNSETGRVVYISGDVSSKVYEATLTAGKINYIHIGYKKTVYYGSGLDTFTINGIYTSIDKGDISQNITTKVPVLNEKVDTVELIKDITLTSPIEINETKEMVLDLKGYTLTTSSNDYVIKNSGDLTIIDSKYLSDIEQNQKDYEAEQAKYDELYNSQIEHYNSYKETVKNQYDDDYKNEVKKAIESESKLEENLFFSKYTVSSSNELLCILSGRSYYKTNNEKAVGAYYYNGNYTGVLLIGLTKDSVSYTTLGNTFKYNTTYEYKGKTYYISSTEYWMGGNINSTGGLLTKLKSTNQNDAITELFTLSFNSSDILFDNDYETYYESDEVSNLEVPIELNTEATMTNFKIYGSDEINKYPTSVELKGSKDGKNYKTVIKSDLIQKGTNDYNEIVIDENNYDSYLYFKLIFKNENSTIKIAEIETDIYDVSRESVECSSVNKKFMIEAEDTNIVSGNPNWSNSSFSGGHGVDYAYDLSFEYDSKNIGEKKLKIFGSYLSRNVKIYLNDTEIYSGSLGTSSNYGNFEILLGNLEKKKYTIRFTSVNGNYAPIYDYFEVYGVSSFKCDAFNESVISLDNFKFIDSNNNTYKNGSYYYVNGANNGLLSYSKKVKVENGEIYTAKGDLSIYNNSSNNTKLYVGFARTQDLNIDDFSSYKIYQVNTTNSSNIQNFNVSIYEEGEFYFKIIIYKEDSKSYNSYLKINNIKFTMLPELQKATLKKATLTGTITSTTNSVIYNDLGASLVIKDGNMVLNKSGEYDIITNEGNISLFKDVVLNTKQANNRAIYNGYKGIIKNANMVINQDSSGYGIYNYSSLNNNFEGSTFNLSSGYAIFNRQSTLTVNNINVNGGTAYSNDSNLIINNSNLSTKIRSTGNVDFNNTTLKYISDSSSDYVFNGIITINNSTFNLPWFLGNYNVDNSITINNSDINVNSSIGRMKNLYINNSTFNSISTQYDWNAIDNVTNLVINNSIVNSTVRRSEYNVIGNCENVEIKGETVINNSYEGNTISATNITIGEKDNKSNDYPKITNSTGSGLKTNNLNIYDGTITTKKGLSILGSITEIEDSYKVNVVYNEDGTETLSLVEPTDVVAKIGEKTYTKLGDALAEVSDNETIYLLKNVYPIEAFTLSESKIFKIDLNSNEIRGFNSDKLFENAGTHEIIDSVNENKGTISNSGSYVLINNGTLNSNNVNFSSRNNLINNYGSIKLDNTDVSASGGYLINNDKDGIIESTSSVFNVGTINNSGSIKLNDVTINDSIITNNENATLSLLKSRLENRISGSNKGITNSGVLTTEDCAIKFYYGYILNNASGTYTTTNDTYTGLDDRYSVIQSSGIFNIYGISTSNRIFNKADGLLNIYSGNYHIVNVSDNSKTNIYGGTLNGYISNEGANSVLNINAGIFNWSSAGSSYVINNSSTGTVNIGVKDGKVDNDSIKISSTEKGLYNNTGTLNFYDGIVKGVTAIQGKVNDVEDGYDIVKETDGNLEVKYLGKVYAAQIESTGEKYYSIKEAIDTVTKDGEIIKLLRNITTFTTAETIEISDNKNVILDLNGYTINQGNKPLINNNGTLTLRDSSDTTTDSYGNVKYKGQIITSNGTIINNNGSFIFESGTITSDVQVDNLITNTNNMTINNGYVTVSGRSSDLIINSGILTINDGRFCTENFIQSIVNNKVGATLTINGGKYYKNGDGIEITNEGTAYIYGGNFTVIENLIYNKETGVAKIDGLTGVSVEWLTNYGTMDISNSSIGENYMYNYATLNLTNVTLLYGSIQNSNDVGEININGGTYNGEISANSGKLSIIDGTFNKTIRNWRGTVNIRGGKFASGVNNSGSGTINIGTKGDITDSGELNVSTDNPNITNTTYGVINTNGGIVNFYDGIISGTTDAINGTINEVEDGYEIISDTTDGGKKSKYLSRLPVAEVESTGDTYYTLQEAIDAATNSKEVIKLLRRFTTLNTLKTTKIPEDKDIILDLNGYALEQNNENFLSNNGTLKITDSSEDNLGKIVMYTNKSIENNGVMVIENINISVNKALSNLINNNDSLKVNNVKINSSNNISNFINNSGVLEMNVGEYSISNGTFIYNLSSGSITMDSITTTGNNSLIIVNNSGTSNNVKILNSNFSGRVINSESGTIVIDNLVSTSEVNNNKTGVINISNSNIRSVYNSNGIVDLNTVTVNGISAEGSGTTNINGMILNSGSIVNRNSHVINIYDASVENDWISIYNNNAGSIINIYGGSFNSTKQNTVSNIGTINIYGGTITSTVGNSITNTGTINIGTKDGNVSTEMPVITGKTYGVNNSDSGKVNFYDGIVSGESGAFYGTVNDVEPGYKIVTNKTDTLTSATLTLVGDDEKVAVLNGINFTSLQDAINSASDTNESIITLYKDVTFESNITVPANKNIKLYLNGYTLNKVSYDFTGEGKITVIDGTSTNALANIMESVKEVLNIEVIKKNIIIYEMDDGSAISSESTYKLYKDNEEVMLEEDAIGIYSVGNSNDEIRSANNKIYINELPKGKYKLIGDNNKEVKFEIDESGKVIGNVKENTKETRKLVSTAVAELIIMIQTGIEKVNYIMIILTLLVTISSLLYIVKKTNVKES